MGGPDSFQGVAFGLDLAIPVERGIHCHLHGTPRRFPSHHGKTL